MSKLNAPRTVPYDFRLAAIDGWVWLFDESERTYICSATPMVYAEPMYPLEESDDESPEPDYFAEGTIRVAYALPVSCGPDVSHEDAWTQASEEAMTNHRL